MASRNPYLLSLLLPIALLGVSFVVTPHLFTVGSLRHGDLAPLPDLPVLLYRRGTFAVYYTSRDLLHPEAFGRPGQFYQAIVFDIWPANEGNADDVDRLTWILQIYRALQVQDAEGKPMPNVRATDVDESLAQDFRRTFIGPPKLERGQVLPFLVPVESTYRKISGIAALLAMAVKNPGENRFYPRLVGTPQLFAQSLELALKTAAEKKLTGVGVPFIPASGAVGESVSPSRSWMRILDEVDRKAAPSGMQRVVLGGYGLLPETRKATDRAFRQAWTEWRDKLEGDANRPAQEEIRLTALIALASLAGALWRRKPFAWQRVLAMLVIAATLAVSVVSLFNWVQPLLPRSVLWPVALMIKVLLAVLAGAFIDRLVRFEPHAALKQEEPQQGLEG
jgi:hypothetical protein